MRGAWLAVACLLLAGSVAGCSSASEGPRFQLAGWFTADFDETDRTEFNAIVRPYSKDVTFMESSPEQFMVRGIVGGCEQLRAELDAKPYVGFIGACVAQGQASATDDGDEATSNDQASRCHVDPDACLATRIRATAG